jgi:hypothetical protein
MQNLSSFCILPLSALLFIANLEMCHATAISINQAMQPFPFWVSDKEPLTNNRLLSEFEGQYKVGKTSCKVVPVKMAFEVKWQKGQGIMNFFFDKTTPDGRYIFVSAKYGNSRDKFIFEDNTYDSGIFIRADGKIFKVNRLNNPNSLPIIKPNTRL